MRLRCRPTLTRKQLGLKLTGRKRRKRNIKTLHPVSSGSAVGPQLRGLWCRCSRRKSGRRWTSRACGMCGSQEERARQRWRMLELSRLKHRRNQKLHGVEELLEMKQKSLG